MVVMMMILDVRLPPTKVSRRKVTRTVSLLLLVVPSYSYHSLLVVVLLDIRSSPSWWILDFNKVIQLGTNHPRIADAYYNRADTYIKLAMLDFEKYLEYAPDSPEKETVQKAVEQLRARRL